MSEAGRQWTHAALRAGLHAAREAQRCPTCEPEIPVTEEMIAAGGEASMLFELGVFASTVGRTEAIYRAMAALAPPADTAVWEAAETQWRTAITKAAELQAANQQWADKFAATEWQRQALEAENATLRLQLAAQPPAAFGPATDTADPPRRPDGTLAPVARPLPVMKTQDPSRRVGG